MNESTAKALDEVLSENDINSVLELGSGVKSTIRISEYLHEKNGRLVSLEQNSGWKTKVLNHEWYCCHGYGKCKISGSSSQEIILCDVIQDGGYVKYSYDIDGSEKFDLIFIDGPGPLKSDNKIIVKEGIYRHIDGAGKISGQQSAMILDYVLPACHDKTILILDGRVASAVYYVYKYSDKFTFKVIGGGRNIHIDYWKKILEEDVFEKVLKIAGEEIFSCGALTMYRR